MTGHCTLIHIQLANVLIYFTGMTIAGTGTRAIATDGNTSHGCRTLIRIILISTGGHGRGVVSWTEFLHSNFVLDALLVGEIRHC